MNKFTIVLPLLICVSCLKDRYKQEPEIVPVEQGLQISAALGYSASVAIAVFKGQVPSNVVYTSKSPGEFSSAGTMVVTIDQNHPMPFTKKTGQLMIAGIWDGEGGILSVAFVDLHFLAGESRFYGLYTIPLAYNEQTGKYVAIFAQQDVVIGEGSDTILNLSFSRPQFNTELERLNTPQPTDMFVAASQNVWFVNIDQNGTASELYDDFYSFYGGGQIAEVRSSTGGVMYHSLIGAEVKLDQCILNPIHGDAFIQNVKAAGLPDLGTIVMAFHSECDGQVYVSTATGKYFRASKNDLTLKLP